MTPKTTTAQPTLTLERVFQATPEKLWAYWTEPLRYARWINPAPDHGIVVHEWDLRVGGKVRFDMPQPDGNPNPQEGVFHELVPFQRLVSGDADKSFLLEVDFEPVDAKSTRLRVRATGVPLDWHAAATKGWGACFDKLTREVATPSVFEVRRTYAPTFTIERTFKAPVEKLWAMWTTKAGLEKWYWPEGLVAKVKRLDLRVGGGYEIAAEGLPHTSRGTFTEIVPGQRLGILAHVDFLPDVEPYDRIDTLEFSSVPGGSKLVARATRMHNDQWNSLSALGFTSSLEKLARALEGGSGPAGPPPGAKGFTIERTFRAAPEKVWAMWTTKAGIEKWWVRSAKDMGYDMRVLEMDVRVGGKFAFEMKNPEHRLVNGGVYVSVQPHTELAWVWHFDIFLAADEKPYDVPISVTLQKTPTGGTKMTFTQGPLATPEYTEGSRQGVLANLELMAKALGE